MAKRRKRTRCRTITPTADTGAPLTGTELADSIELTVHAIARFRGRTGFVGDQQAAETAIRTAIADSGVVATNPPAWSFGAYARTAFWVVIDNSWVLPVTANHPGARQPYVATTFIARAISAYDLDTFSGAMFANALLAEPVLAAFGGAEADLREALAAGRATLHAPAWLPNEDLRTGEFFICADDVCVLARRANQSERHHAALVATALFTPEALTQLAGDALVGAIQLEPRALTEFRDGAGYVENVREALTARIADGGTLTEDLPAWLAPYLPGRHLTVALDDEAVLVLAAGADGGAARWRAVGCFWRHFCAAPEPVAC